MSAALIALAVVLAPVAAIPVVVEVVAAVSL
jgi:hypothetical protein